MADKNLNDDMVKLVSYTIVTIQREDEEALESKSLIVTDSMTEDGFVAWRIAEYQKKKKVSSSAAKYLRLYYTVQDRWAKQDLHYEEKQLLALEGIEAAILKKKK